MKPSLIMLLSLLFAPLIHAQDVRTVTPEEAQSLIARDSSAMVLDVRSDAEFRAGLGHLPNAILIPLPDLEKRIPEIDSLKSRKIIAYCHSGRRSKIAAGLLQSKGFTVWSLDGGITRWASEGRPVVHQSKESQ